MLLALVGVVMKAPKLLSCADARRDSPGTVYEEELRTAVGRSGVSKALHCRWVGAAFIIISSLFEFVGKLLYVKGLFWKCDSGATQGEDTFAEVVGVNRGIDEVEYCV